MNIFRLTMSYHFITQKIYMRNTNLLFEKKYPS